MGELVEVDMEFDDTVEDSKSVIPEESRPFSNDYRARPRPSFPYWAAFDERLERGEVLVIYWQAGFLGQITVGMGREEIDSVDAEGTFGEYRYEAFRSGDHTLHITRDDDDGNWPDAFVWVEEK